MKNPVLLLGAILLLFLENPVSVQAGAAKPVATLKLVADGFVSPVGMATYPGPSSEILVVDQIGTIERVTTDGRKLPFLDLRDRLIKLNEGFDERGLVGFALHPKFAENRRMFVYYNAPRRASAPADWDHTVHLSEIKVGPDDVAIPASERTLLVFDLPYFNHHGGGLAFGPDGFLYISVGDGGNANDTGRGHGEGGNGQNLGVLLGKILRIDVDRGRPYAVPFDNPFTSTKGARPEIFAYGFRNPWRISFDRGGTHELFAADVGQELFEEIDLVVKGGNYGWNLREGRHGFDPANPGKPPADAPASGNDGRPLIDPIIEYKNARGFPKDPEARGASVIGGHVYRGRALPALTGRYIFGDWSRSFAQLDGSLFFATRPAGGTSAWTFEPLELGNHPGGRLKANLLSLGEDAEGELYVLTTGFNGLKINAGKVYKLVPP